MSAQVVQTNKNRASGKVLAWYSIITGILTIAAPFLAPIFMGVTLSQFYFYYFIGLGIFTVATGVWCLQPTPAPFYVLLFLFLIQTIEFGSEGFSFSFIGPFSIKFGWGYNDPPSVFNINILAVIGCFVSLFNARHLTIHSTRPPGSG